MNNIIKYLSKVYLYLSLVLVLPGGCSQCKKTKQGEKNAQSIIINLRDKGIQAAKEHNLQDYNKYLGVLETQNKKKISPALDAAIQQLRAEKLVMDIFSLQKTVREAVSETGGGRGIDLARVNQMINNIEKELAVVEALGNYAPDLIVKAKNDLQSAKLAIVAPLKGSNSSSSSRWAPPRLDPGGIVNVGNTCYMNTALQMLAACYHDKFQGISPLKVILDKIKTCKECVTMGEVEAFISYLDKSKLKIGESKFSMKQQQDPAEFFTILNNHHEFFEKIGIQSCISHEKDGDFISRNNESLSMLSLGLLSGNMQKIVDSFSKEEMIEDYKVGGCNKNVDKVQNLKQVGTILPIQLKRFKFDNNKISKIETNCLSPLDNIKINHHAYSLIGFIHHCGGSAHYGHYTAYIKKDNQWFCANDSRVTEIPKDEAGKVAATAYIYFYKKG